MKPLRTGKYARALPTESGWSFNLLQRFIRRRKAEILDNMIFFARPLAPSRHLIAPAKMKVVLTEAKANGNVLLVENVEHAWLRLCRTLDNNSFFDICPIDQIIKFCEVQLNAETDPIYKGLYQLHCRDYKNMPEELIHKLPEYINTIFAEGHNIMKAHA